MADFTALKNSIRNYIKQNGNAEITGEVLQNILISMVVSMGDGAINGIADGLTNEANARTNADGLLQDAIDSISAALGDGYTYAGIATPATTPTSGKVFYFALQAGTYTNFGGAVVTQGVTILKNNNGTWQLDNVIGIDDVPTAGSPKLVKSGGVFANMGAFDISDYNKSGSTLATYADLTAALAALPSEYQKGGMSVKFIQSSDNKYVQYFLTKDEWSISVADWEKVISEYIERQDMPLINSEDEISIFDSNDNEVVTVNTDGVNIKKLKIGDTSDSDIKVIEPEEYTEEVSILDSNDNEVVNIGNNGVNVKGVQIGDANDSDIKAIKIEEDVEEISILDSENTEVFNINENRLASNKPIFINNKSVATEDDVANLQTSLVNISGEVSGIKDDVEILKSHSSGSVSFSINFILSDVINNNDLFIMNDKVVINGNYTALQNYSSTSFVNIIGIVYLEYDNLHAVDAVNGYYPIFLYDKDFSFINHANVDVNQSKNTAGSLDLSQYPTAAYAVFCNDTDENIPSIQMFTRTEKIKKDRNNILVGAYYFAGWSEIDFPNIHHTDALLNTYSGRKPIWGWLDHGSFRGDGWLITPNITLGAGTATLSILNSCLFHKEGQCRLYIKESGGTWVEKTIELPNATTTSFTTTIVDITEFANKNIQVGFRLKTSEGDESAIWTINRITVISNNVTLYDRDYTNHENFDCEITDTDIWKPATWTRGYENLNGYVGTTVNQKDTSIIDKQIVLAKEHGIDYFMLEWFYYDNNSTFNEAASYAEDNHIAVHAFMNSCQKLGFKFAVMVTNHSPFIIDGIENWKDAFRYLNREYFKDPSYLIVDNKPVVCIFDKTKYIEAGPTEINNFFITELGYDGVYILYTTYNVPPNSKEVVERNIDDLYNAVISWNKKAYVDEHIYNVVEHVTCGWDSRPWAVRPSGYSRPSDWFVPDINKWRNLFDWVYRFTKIYNNGKFKSCLICAWNEYGEGSYLVPTEDDKRGEMLLAIGNTVDNYKL